MADNYRKEKDSMGIVRVPKSAYYGAQTQRAKENFTMSGLTLPSDFIMALGLIKAHAAQANLELGLLDKELADAISKVAREVVDGKLDDQFVVDVFQTGSGTSTNMNANEVIAGRANEILTGKIGGKSPVRDEVDNDQVHGCSSQRPPTARGDRQVTTAKKRYDQLSHVSLLPLLSLSA